VFCIMRTCVLLTTLLAAASETCTLPDVSAGLHKAKCQGIKFQYNIPAQCASGESCGLVLDVHGWTMNGDAQDANTGMRALGEQHGYIVVQPTSNHEHILGLLPLPVTSWSEKDYPAVWAILEGTRDAQELKVDPARVHFMGFSQGSMMTWWMLEHHGKELASAVPMSCAAQGSVTAVAVAAAASGTPLLVSHGYNDGLCPFRQGNATVNTLMSEWKLEQVGVLSEDDHHVRRAYKGPDGQYLETLFWDYESGSWRHGLGSICGIIYKAIGDGHCFPGGSDTQCFDLAHPRVSFPERLAPFSCPAPDTAAAAFVIGEVAMQFFIDHPRRATDTVV